MLSNPKKPSRYIKLAYIFLRNKKTDIYVQQRTDYAHKKESNPSIYTLFYLLLQLVCNIDITIRIKVDRNESV